MPKSVSPAAAMGTLQFGICTTRPWSGEVGKGARAYAKHPAHDVGPFGEV